jgi:UDP-N-acetylmuramyl pentapeptide phosphotransferase/UDP-N-acetylglucosamine-1-phosphate transferase
MTVHLLSTALLATSASAAVGALIVLSQRWHGKHTLDHDLDGVQKFHTTAVPRVGGLAIVAAVLFALVSSNHFIHDPVLTQQLRVAAFLLIAGMPAFAAGIIEDLTKNVSVKVRLVASVISALLASWLVSATLDELNIWGVDALLAWQPFALVVTAIAVSGGVNAINIIDGFHGLASSTVIVMLAALGAIGWHVGDLQVAELAFLGLGAALGFIIVNYPTGRLFLGDGGAYFLGFWVAEVMVLLLVRNDSVSAWQLLSICAYPVIEVLFSIYRRKIVRKSSPGSPDGLHLHSLVYRRFISRQLPRDEAQPWKRNAAVTRVMLPWIAIASLLSVVAGRTTWGAMAIVIAQVVIYVAIYTRLVRGHWRFRRTGPRATDKGVKIEA